MPYDPETGDWIDPSEVDPEPEPKRDPEPKTPNFRRQLEQRARDAEAKAAAAEAELEQAANARRELALLKAGIDTESGPGKLFARAYDGELTTEAIKTAATEYGVLAPPAPSVPPAELAAHTAASTASAGAVPTQDAGWRSDLEAIPPITDGGWNPDFEQQVLNTVAKHGGRVGSGEVTKWTADGGQTWTAEPQLAQGQG